LTSRADRRRVFLGNLVVAQANVFGQRAGEEEGVLQHHRKVAAKGIEIL